MTLDQQFDVRTLRILRETVAAHASAAGMPDQRAADVMLAVHELAANAVLHGGGTGRIQMQVAAGKLVCQVSDVGPAALDGVVARQTPATRRPDDTPVQPWSYEPGHGLWLASRVADGISVYTSPAGSKVTVVFALVPGDAPEGLMGADLARQQAARTAGPAGVEDKSTRAGQTSPSSAHGMNPDSAGRCEQRKWHQRAGVSHSPLLVGDLVASRRTRRSNNAGCHSLVKADRRRESGAPSRRAMVVTITANAAPE